MLKEEENKLYIINDCDKKLSNELNEKFGKILFDYSLMSKNQGEINYTIDFVGFIKNKNSTLLSMPKHYLTDDNDLAIKTIIKILFMYCNSKGMDDSSELYTNLPFNAYIDILNYYFKYGLYKDTKDECEFGYNGKINWKKTLNKAPKIINNDNLLFLPFVINKKQNTENIITHVMKYVLFDGYLQIGQYLDVNLEIKETVLNDDISHIIDLLSIARKSTFKDLTMKLIDNLIKYLLWKNANSDTTYFITRKFNKVWEGMIADYLNRNFDSINDKNELVFKTKVRKFKFDIQKSVAYSSNKHILYDYYKEDQDNVYIFDAKYYESIDELDYKQTVYHYNIIQDLKERNKTNYIIHNYLIAPNEENNHKVHADRKNKDGVLIYEEYLSIKDVMESLV